MPNIRVLVVEDDPIVATDITNILTMLDYDIAGTAASGEEAVEISSARPPDLILMDVYLSGELNGVEAAKEIRAKKDIPIIFITAYSDDKVLEDAKFVEPFGYILKPFDVEELKTTIRIALYKHEIDKRVKESEHRYRSLFGNMLNGFVYNRIIFDNKGNPVDFEILEANDAVETHTGINPADVVGKRFSQVFPAFALKPGKGIKYLSILSNAGGSVEVKEYYFKPLKRWYTVSAFRIEDGYFAVTFSDITQQRQAEQALRESEARFRAVFEAGSDPIIIWDKTHVFLFANQAALDFLGKPDGRVVGKRTPKVLSKDRLLMETLVSRVDLALATGQALNFVDTRQNSNEDGYQYINSVFTPIKNDKGEIFAVSLVARDISERKKVELALGESRLRLELALEVMADGLWDHDLAADTVYYSPRYAEMLGFSQEETGQTVEFWKSRLHPEDAESVLAALDAHIQGVTPVFRVKCRLRKKDGTWLWVESRSRVAEWDHQGRASRLVGAITDITTLKQAEAELTGNRNDAGGA